MTPGYFQVIAEPVSTCVQEIFEFRPAHLPRLVTKLKIPPRPSASPGYQFCTASEKEQKMIPSSPSFFLKVVATETLSNTASTATPASHFCSSSGMPSLS